VYVKDYKIEKVLGEGGFGITYLGHKHGKSYAVKEMERQDAKEEYDVMKKLANVCSHHVLCPVELIKTPTADSYLVSDLIKGHDLERYLRRKDNVFVTRVFMTRFLEQMLDALATIHSLGVAHRDLKPENIMVSTDRRVFTLIDFGLGVTHGTKDLYGTKLYVAPNVYELRNAERVIPLNAFFGSDLFALGVTMFELLESGKYPFKRLDRGVNRYTPVSNTKKERVPYDINARQNYITSPRAPVWMRHVFEIMTYMSTWNTYDGFFTAKTLHDAVVNKEHKFIKGIVDNYDEFL
jgi:serine/threonine-protein kinase